MGRRFLIYGHGGCYNHGGEALATCGIQVLRERYPGCSIIVSSHNPDNDLEFHLPADEIVGRDETYLPFERSTNYSIENNDRIYKSTIERITPDTVAIHLGGDNYCYPNWKRYANIHYRALEKGAKSVLWSCSVDPDAIDSEMLHALKTHHLIAAREDITYRALKERGISQVVKVSDIAFRLVPSAVPFDLENYVSLTFGPLAEKKETSTGMALSSFERLINYILTETDMNIALVPHVICKVDSDLEWMAKVNTHGSSRIRLVSDHYNAAQLKHIIAAARFAVTLRTHASIAAYSSCVPTLVAGYSMKSSGIARDLGMSEYVLQIKDLRDDTKLTNAFKKLTADENAVKKRLKQIMPQYIQNAICEEAFHFDGLGNILSKVYIQTITYNAEKTIRRCVESILNQTYKGEICWDILDNGSTDHTFSILSDYAQRDDRINLLHIDCNCSPKNEKELAVWNRFYRRSGLTSCDGEYYCTLDSDDAYQLDFLEKTLAFIKENDLDMAAVGNDIIDAATNKTAVVRKLGQNIILAGPDTYNGYFQHYHQFFRSVWGKVYKMSLLKNYVRNDDLSYGSDTWFVFYTARQAKRIGVLAQSLHKYYISPKSISYQWDKKRIRSDRILHETVRDFLVEKCGAVSRQNEDYQLAVYTNALKDTLNVLQNASIPLREKIEGVVDIVNDTYTRQLIAREEFCFSFNAVKEMFAMRKDLVSTTANWLLSLNEVPDELVEGYCDAGELLCAAAENADGWLFFKKLRVRFFLAQNRKDEAMHSLNELMELISSDPEVIEFQKFF